MLSCVAHANLPQVPRPETRAAQGSVAWHMKYPDLALGLKTGRPQLTEEREERSLESSELCRLHSRTFSAPSGEAQKMLM